MNEAGAAPPVIEIDHLSKRYGEITGVEELSLTLPGASLLGFLGPNGAGKSTTLRCLLGLLRPTSGSARLFGLNCWTRGAEIRRRVGYLPGDLRLPLRWTGHDAIAIAGGARRLDLRRPGAELAELFELDLGLRVRTMSRGTRQKLGLVLALAHDPDLLLLDEPTTGLDPIHQERLARTLRERADRGRSVFFSSHVLHEVESLCSRVAILRRGRLVAEESIEGLRGRAHRVVRIRWARPVTEEAPPFLELAERTDREWRGALAGSVAELVSWLADGGARAPVADLEVGAPDLEEVFHRLYRDGAGT